MTDVVFPVLSTAEPDKEGVVATWFVAHGQRVTAGQLLAEVQLDKVAVEVSAPVAGAVHLKVAEQAPLRQGQVIATVT